MLFIYFSFDHRCFHSLHAYNNGPVFKNMHFETNFAISSRQINMLTYGQNSYKVLRI